MADQNITELPIKTNSGVASTDYMLGIDSAEGYQILVRDVAKYIIENYNGSALAGPQQSIQSAFQNGTYLLRSGTAITSQADLNNYYNIGNYYCGANSVVTSLSNCPVSKAFIMKVEWSSGNGNPRQIIHVYDTYECYIRWTSKLDGTGWSEWVKQPTRTEITELNSKLVYHSYAKSIAPLNITLDAESAYLLVIARYGGNGLDGSGMTAIVATAATGKADRVFSLASSNDYSVTVADKVLTIANTSTSTNMYALINVLKLS